MYLENFNFFVILIFVISLFFWITYFYYFSKNNKNIIKYIFLAISFLLIIINIFWIKSTFNIGNKNILWWKVLFVMDVSKSMNTDDIIWQNKMISRLDFTKNFIKDFVINNRKNNYSLTVFAWETLEILPFTNDISLFLKILNWINNDNVSKNWSELIWVFESIIDCFPWNENWTVVIFTDGWDEKIDLLKNTVNNINSKKINIIIAWVWSTKWDYIPDWYDVWWNIIYKTYQWKKILSKLNYKNMSDIASNFDFNFFTIDSIKTQNKLEKLISSQVEKNTLVNNTEDYFYLTRFLIFLSFIFFILFLFLDNFIWKK